MGVSRNTGTILGSLIIKSIIFWCLYWGPRILENYHIGPKKEMSKQINRASAFTFLITEPQ